MAGYTPGEQPRDGGIIKLNTNENPYPPSPRVFEAIRGGPDRRPAPQVPRSARHRFRQAAGQVLDVDPDGILIGNGSDDILTILTRAFVPEGGLVVSPTPSYVLYRTLAEIRGRASRRCRSPRTGGCRGRGRCRRAPDASSPIRIRRRAPSFPLRQLERLAARATRRRWSSTRRTSISPRRMPCPWPGDECHRDAHAEQVVLAWPASASASRVADPGLVRELTR